jgi:cell division protein FtsL
MAGVASWLRALASTPTIKKTMRIQSLNQKADEKDVSIQEQATEIRELKQSVDDIKNWSQMLAEKK